MSLRSAAPERASAPERSGAPTIRPLASRRNLAIDIEANGAGPVKINDLFYGSAIIGYVHGMSYPQYCGVAGSGLVKKNGSSYNSLLWDEDKIDMLKDMGIKCLRYNTDRNTHYWRYEVGPLASRAPYVEENSQQTYGAAYGIDEHMYVCKRLGAECISMLPWYKGYQGQKIENWKTWQERAELPTAEVTAKNFVAYCNMESPGLAYGESQSWTPTTFDDISGLSTWQSNTNYTVGDKVKIQSIGWGMYFAFECVQNHTSTDTPMSANMPLNYSTVNTTYWHWIPRIEVEDGTTCWAADNPDAPPEYFAWLREYFASLRPGNPTAWNNAEAEPYNIKYFELGNEVYWHWGEWKYPPPGVKYRKGLMTYKKLINEVDPNAQIGAVMFHSPVSNSGVPGYDEWNIQCAKLNYKNHDFVIPHWYQTPGNNLLTRAGVLENINQADSPLNLNSGVVGYSGVPFIAKDSDKPIFITEHNLDASNYSLYNEFNLAAAFIYCARLLGYARFEQVYSVAHFNTLGVNGSDTITKFSCIINDNLKQNQGPIRNIVTPTFYALKMMGNYGVGNYWPVDSCYEWIRAGIYYSNDYINVFIINFDNAYRTLSIKLPMLPADTTQLPNENKTIIYTLESNVDMPDPLQATNNKKDGSYIPIIEVLDPMRAGAEKYTDITKQAFNWTVKPCSMTLLRIPADSLQIS